MAIYESGAQRYPSDRQDAQHDDRIREEKKSARTVSAASAAEAILSAGAAVLAILGLTGVSPALMTRISVIAAGSALFLVSAAVAARYSEMYSDIAAGRLQNAELTGGMGIEALGGLAAVVLGILALVGINPDVLTSTAVISLGVAAIFGTGMDHRLSLMEIDGDYGSTRAARTAREAMIGTAALKFAAGFAAVVLGILALLGYNPAVLNMCGVLSLSAAALIAASTVTTRMAMLLRAH